MADPVTSGERAAVPNDVTFQRHWHIGEMVAEGGTGEIYAATDDAGQICVAKFVPKFPGAEREAGFSNPSARNVIPVLDVGATPTHYVLVMPRAEKSLARHLAEVGRLPPEEVIAILVDVTQTLVDLAGNIVHRDIKPSNILLYSGHWCLTDFGIARYVDATTATHTFRGHGSSPYSPPERWRGSTVETAGDVYSLGATAYEMLAGSPPFNGPDYMLQHLTEPPPPLVGVPSRLADLVAECLSKVPDRRPRPPHLLQRLSRVLTATPPAAERLAAANQHVITRREHDAARSLAVAQAELQRDELGRMGVSRLAGIAQRLRATILDVATAAEQPPTQGGWRIKLGEGSLLYWEPEFTPWERGPGPIFDVVASSSLTIHVSPRNHWMGRSHSLWFCDAVQPGEFRWFETAFYGTVISTTQDYVRPFSLSPAQARGAFSGGISGVELDLALRPIDLDAEEDFISRWLELFGRAADGDLQEPLGYPEHGDIESSYRRA